MGDGMSEFNDGFIDGYFGREARKESPEYESGYGRGYATAEIESANNEWEVNNGRRR